MIHQDHLHHYNSPVVHVKILSDTILIGFTFKSFFEETLCIAPAEDLKSWSKLSQSKFNLRAIWTSCCRKKLLSLSLQFLFFWWQSFTYFSGTKSVSFQRFSFMKIRAYFRFISKNLWVRILYFSPSSTFYFFINLRKVKAHFF